MNNLKFSPFFYYNLGLHKHILMDGKFTRTNHIQNGDLAFSGNEEKQEIQNVLVERRSMYEITLQNGNSIVVDENNYLFTKDKGWIRAKDLTENSLILNGLNLIRNDAGILNGKVGFENNIKGKMMPVHVPSNNSEKLSEWIGIMSAHGEFSKEEKIILTIDEKKYPHLVDHYVRLTKEVFNITPLREINSRENRKPYWFFISTNVCDFLKTFLGRQFGVRKVPSFIMEASIKEQLAYIKGIGFRGYKERNAVVLYQGVSKPIYDFCSLILRSCGFQISQQTKKLQKDKNIFYYIRIIGRYKNAYELYFYNQDCLFINYKWSSDVVFFNDKKLKYMTIAQRKKKIKDVDFEHIWIPLKSVNSLGERDAVVIKGAKPNGFNYNQIILAGCVH